LTEFLLSFFLGRKIKGFALSGALFFLSRSRKGKVGLFQEEKVGICPLPWCFSLLPPVLSILFHLVCPTLGSGFIALWKKRSPRVFLGFPSSGT
jgi:hypothetical protein